MSLLIFYFLVKFEVKKILESPTFKYGCLVGLHNQGRDEAETRGTDEQQWSDKPPLIRCG